MNLLDSILNNSHFWAAIGGGAFIAVAPPLFRWVHAQLFRGTKTSNIAKAGKRSAQQVVVDYIDQTLASYEALSLVELDNPSPADEAKINRVLAQLDNSLSQVQKLGLATPAGPVQRWQARAIHAFLTAVTEPLRTDDLSGALEVAESRMQELEGYNFKRRGVLAMKGAG